MSNNDDNKPGYFNGLPLNLKMNMDDDIDEVTRKIAPAMVMPSLGPLPTMPPNSGGGGAAAVTINTSPLKTQTPSLGRYVFGQLQHKEKQYKTPSPSSSRFVWNQPTVPSLPEFHPLERTAVFVPNTSTAPFEVASRISNVLRERSVEAQYDTSKAKVKCKSAEGVDFRIRLYRGRGRYNHGIIVEVQRRFGTSLVFHQDAEAILNAAEGKVVLPPLSSALSALPPLTLTSNNLPDVTDEDDNDDNDACNDYYKSQSHGRKDYPVPSADSSLVMVAKMMNLPGFDSQYLGLQILSSLVDSDKLSLSTARAVATKIFERENEVGTKVLEYIINKSKTRAKKMVEGKRKPRGVFDDDDDEDENSILLRNICLNVLANSLRAYGRVPTFLCDNELPLSLALRSALLRDLKEAEVHPNTALLSAKCMEYYVKVDVDHDHCDATELCEAFIIAQNVGEARHANLLRQTRKCMIAIR